MLSFTRKRLLVVFVFITCAVFAGVKFGSASHAESGATGIVPAISATKVDSIFTDVDGDGRADPGDTLLYTVTINNTGTDASNMVFSDTIDANTTLVGGSVNSSPIAFDDAGYTAAGNVRITISAATGVLANDIDPDTGTNTGLTASAGTTSAQGGNVAMSANGGFAYNPAPGFTGTDTFTYTVTDAGGATGTGTVTFNVSGMIWFVNAVAGGGGDGRLTSPFNCYTGAGCFSTVAADDPGDNIFLYSGAYTGGNTLLANQRLIGQGAGASLSTITGITPPTGSDSLPSTGGTRPAMTTVIAATNAVNLGSGNTLRGFNIGNTTAADIAGTSFGTLTASEIDLSGTGQPLNLTTGTLAATFDSLTATSAPGGPGVSLATVGGTLTVSGVTNIAGAGTQGISISGSSVAASFGTSTTIGSTAQGILVGTSTGNISFGNTTVTAGTDGVSLQNNSAGTRSFGTLSVTNGSGRSFLHAVGGGTTTVTGLATLTNPASNCIDIQDSTTAVTFANVNCTGSAATGVFMDDNSGAVTFADLDIDTDTNVRAIQATAGNTGLITSTSGTIADTGTAIAVDIAGTSSASRTPLNMQLTSVSSSGASSGIILTNTSASGNPGGFVVLGNSAGICGGSVTNTTTPAIAATVTAPVTGDCTGGTIQNSTGDGIRLNYVANVSLTRMQVVNGATNGIFGTEVNGFQLFSSYISNNGSNVDHVGLKFTDVTNPGTFNGLVGSALAGANPTRFINSTVRQSGEFNVEILNRTGTLTDLLVDGCQFTDTKLNAGPGDADGFFAQMENTAVGTLRLTNSYFSNNFTQGAQLAAIDSANLTVTVTSSTFTNNNEGFVCNHSQSSDMTCTVGGDASTQGNHFEGQPAAVDSGALIVASTGSTGTASASQTTKIKNNFVQAPANMVNHALIVFMSGTLTPGSASIVNNVVNNLTFGHAILVDTPDAVTTTPQFSVTANNNSVTNNAAGGHGVLVQTRKDSAGCVLMQNNTGSVFAGSFVARVRATDSGAMNLKQGVSGSFDPATIMAANNPGATTSVSIAAPGTITGVANGTCTTPVPRPAGLDELTGDPAGEVVAPARGTPLTSVDLLPGVENDATAYWDAFYDERTSAYAQTLETSTLRSMWDGDILPVVSGEGSLENVDLETSETRNGPNAGADVDGIPSFSGEVSFNTTQAPVKTEGIGYWAVVNEVSGKIVSAMMPTAHSQSLEPTQKEPTKDGAPNAPESGETITVNGGSPAGFTLPGGKTTTITFRVTVNTGVLPAFTQVSNQGSISGSNFFAGDNSLVVILTDDPSVGGASDPTVTPIDHTTVAVSSNANPSVSGQNVTFTATMTGVPSRASDPPGTVQFKADGNNIGTAIPIVVGAVNDNVSTAQASISSLTVATHVITAEYSGGGAGATGYNANTGTLAGGQVVGLANTTTGVTSATNPSVFGQSVTFTATVGVTAPGTGTPTGTVQFLDGGNPITGCTSVALAAGSAQCLTAALAVGNHTITAAYGGDGSFNTSNGSMTGNPQVVNKVGTSVGLTSATNPSVFGQSVTFTATIGVTAPGSGTPTGTVQFLDGGNPITGCTSVALAAGSAQCLTAALAVGNHTITAAYSGDGNFNTSNGSMTGNPQVVNKASTTVGLTSATNPSVFGQSVTFTATIGVTAPGAGTPTGTVQFLDGINPITGCTSVAVAAGQAQCLTSTLVVGNHTITAAYSGDGNFNTSNGPMTGNPQVVNKADTSVGLTSAANPTVFGQSVTFTATMSVTAPGAGTPTGTINFLDGGNPITGCQNVAIAAGQAQCLTAALAVGNHTITAAYSGDGNFNTSNGSMTGNPQVVNKAGTTTALASGSNPSVFGQSVTFTATINVTAPGAGTPTGNVTFKDNGVNIGTCAAQTVSTSQATCSISTLAVASHPITAVYNGDGSFNASAASNTVTQVVNMAATTTAITQDAPDPSTAGQNVVVNYTVSVTAPGAGTPTGNVTVSDGVNNCVGTVAAGTCTVALNTLGARNLTATYAGDSSFSGSVSPNEPHQVNSADSTPPTATAALTNVTVPGGALYSFTVTYADNVAVNIATLDSSDIVVTGPNAFTTPATFVSVDVNSNGTPRVATYSFTPPGGTWDPTDNGIYMVTMVAGQVADTNGNFVAAGSLGTFAVLPLDLVVDRTDDNGAANACTAAANDCSLRGAIAAANAATTSDTISFDPVIFFAPQTITLGGTEIVIANNGGLTINGPGADRLTLSGNAASRIFTNSPNAVTTINGMRLTGGTGTGAAGTGRGGAAYNTGGTLTLNGLIITGNTSTNGAALTNATAPATLNVNNCWVTANVTPGSGGAIQNFSGATVVTNITNSSITGNTSNSTTVGGGAIQANGTTTITNSTIGGNTSVGGSGAIFYNGTNLTITNSTISANTSTQNGGGIHSTSATPASIRNSIIAGNNGAVASVDMTGIAASQGNNIIGMVGTSTGWVGSDLQNFDPLLAPLGFYGGNGYSFALTSTSPAINAGQACVLTLTCGGPNPATALTADQRGAGRIGAVDIGAFELNNSALGGTYVANLPSALQGTAYNFLLVPVNGSFAQTVTAGSLPPNILLNVGAATTFSGTPSLSGDYLFSLTSAGGPNSNITDYRLIVFAPPGTLVSVGGRAMSTTGQPAGGVRLFLTDSGVFKQSVTTSPLGYYRFDNVPAGATYTIQANAKRFTLTPVVLPVGYNLTNADLTLTPTP